MEVCGRYAPAALPPKKKLVFIERVSGTVQAVAKSLYGRRNFLTTLYITQA
jgi:hypothetical protein